MAANAAAWHYLSLPKLAQRGRDYLSARGIDVTALEGEAGRPVVGHTPYRPDGLVTHLRRRGFSDDEIVDAGWASRRGAQQLVDRFRRRVIIAVRDQHGRVIGVYGRDVTGTASQKYVNTAETVAFHKGSAVYRPHVGQLDAHATVVVCEGSLDALAVAAHAAAAGQSRDFAPASPSGTASTDCQADLVLAISDRPPLVCADGDEPGIAASEKWIRTLMAHGRETIVTVLPDGHDPASWLREHGVAGLRAFTRKGCLDLPDDAIKPVPAGGLLAQRILAERVAAARKVEPGYRDDLRPALRPTPARRRGEQGTRRGRRSTIRGRRGTRTRPPHRRHGLRRPRAPGARRDAPPSRCAKRCPSSADRHRTHDAMKEVAVLTDLGLISEPTAAAMLGIGYTTLRRMRLRGDGPPFVVLGARLVRYREADLERWLTSRAAVASLIQTRISKATGRKSYRVRYEHMGREHSRTFDRLEDARAFERQLRERIRDGDLPPSRAQRMKSLAMLWADFEGQALLERRTLDRYAQLWRLQVEPEFGHVPASRVSTGDVRSWVARLLSSGLSRASVARAVTVLSCCMKVAIDQGSRRDNPTRGCRPRPDVPEQGRGYSPEEVQTLLAAANARDAPIYLLAATTGPRFGELAGFRVGDLDFAEALLAVQRVVIESKGHQVVKAYPKGGSVARRTLALPPEVTAALKQLADGRKPEAPLWPNRAGGPQYYRAASAALRRTQRAAGLDPAGFHALRRTAATLSLQAGMSLRDVQAMLGHASPLMTMTRYALPDVDAQGGRKRSRRGYDPPPERIRPETGHRS